MPDLSFDPSVFANIAQQKRQAQQNVAYGPFRSANEFGDTLGGIGQDIMQRRQLQLQRQHQQLLDTLAQQQGSREQQTFNLQNQPLVPPSPDTGINQGSPSGMGQPSPMMGNASVSPIVQAHASSTGFNPLNIPIANQGQAQQQPQQTPNTEQPYLDILRNPSETPARQRLAQEAIGRMTQEELTPFEVPMKKAILQKTQAEAQAAGGISPEDWADMQTNNSAGIAQRHNGVIPPHISNTMATMTNQASNRGVTIVGKYQPQIQKEQDQINSIDSTIMGLQSGDAGQIESAQGIVSSALKLSPRLAKEAGGQSYAAELSEWASGKLGNQSVPPELMKPLIHILNLQKLASQSSLNQIKVAAMGEASAYGVHPDVIKSLFTPSNPQISQPQNKVMTATNKKTGKRIKSTDGGKTWQPM